MMPSRREIVTPTPEQEFGKSVERGQTGRYAREDHTHGTPGDPVIDVLSKILGSENKVRIDRNSDGTITITLPSSIQLDGATASRLLATDANKRTVSIDTIVVNDVAKTVTFAAVVEPQNVEGEFYWDPTYKSVCVYNGIGDIVRVGYSTQGVGVNDTGAVSSFGKIVYMKSVQGNRPDFGYADARDGAKVSNIGLCVTSNGNNQEDSVVTFGVAFGLDTSAWAPGTILYVSADATGTPTSTAPSKPNYRVKIGSVLNQHLTQGSIFVRPGIDYADGVTLHSLDILTTLSIGGDTTPEGRLIIPMGEISYFSLAGLAVTITTQSDGSTNMVKVAPATALSGNAYEFDNGGADNGRLRYTGTATKMFHVACTISFSPAAANDTFVIGIAKGGTVISQSKVLHQITGVAAIKSTALHVMVELATNEYLELYVGNTSDTDDFTIEAMTMFAMGL